MKNAFRGYLKMDAEQNDPNIQRYRKFMALQPGKHVFLREGEKLDRKWTALKVVDFPAMKRSGYVVKTDRGTLLLSENVLLEKAELPALIASHFDWLP